MKNQYFSNSKREVMTFGSKRFFSPDGAPTEITLFFSRHGKIDERLNKQTTNYFCLMAISVNLNEFWSF